jgi:diguanylate cyclase (GGDEF)-like protein
LRKSCLVIGAAHLDILATKKGHGPGIDIPGDIDVDFGGCASNAAIALSEQNIEVVFLTVLREGGISNLIVRNLEEHGIRVVPVFRRDISQGGFCGIVENGELASAVTSTPVESHEFDPGQVRELILGADALLIDGNLGRKSLREISAIASRYRVPLSFLAVSEAKAGRFLSIQSPSILFANMAEFLSIAREKKASEDIDGSVRTFVRETGCALVIGRGKEGVLCVTPQEEIAEIPPGPGPVVSTLGAGDALAGGVLGRVVTGMDFLEAVRRSCASEVVRVLSRRSGNIGETDKIDCLIRTVIDSSSNDALTGVLTRGSLMKRAERILAWAGRAGEDVAFLYCDAVRFKEINDTLGHREGDSALVKMAEILKSCVRGDEDCVGRLGGDEFLLVLSGCGELDARAVARRIGKMAGKVRLGPAGEMALGISIGIAAWNGKESLEDVVERSDGAMYQDKKEGRKHRMVLDHGS